MEDEIEDDMTDLENDDKGEKLKQVARKGFSQVDDKGSVSKPSKEELDKFIHMSNEKPATGFYIDPDTIDSEGKFSFRFVYDANDFNEVELIQSITKLLNSDLFLDKEKGTQRRNNFLDFAAQRLRISRDQMERIVSDPDELASFAKNMGVNLTTMKQALSYAEKEEPDFTHFDQPEQITSSDDDLPEDVAEDDNLIFEELKDQDTGEDVIGGL